LHEIPCVVDSVTDTEIVCTTGNKGANNNTEPSAVVVIDGNKALMED